MKIAKQVIVFIGLTLMSALFNTLWHTLALPAYLQWMWEDLCRKTAELWHLAGEEK